MKRMTLNQLKVPGAGMSAQNFSGKLSCFFFFLAPFLCILWEHSDTQFTCFTGTKSTNADANVNIRSLYNQSKFKKEY